MSSPLPGVIVLVAGAVLYRFPPKTINGLYGYRTPRSMRSQAAWNFANRYAAEQMMMAGVACILVTAALTRWGALREPVATIVGVLAAAGWIVGRTELVLRRRFDRNGAPRRPAR
jgi:immunity protein, SdpI family